MPRAERPSRRLRETTAMSTMIVEGEEVGTDMPQSGSRKSWRSWMPAKKIRNYGWECYVKDSNEEDILKRP